MNRKPVIDSTKTTRALRRSTIWTFPVALTLAVTCCQLAPAQMFDWLKREKKQGPAKVADPETSARHDYRTIGDQSAVDGMHAIKVEGYGLVVGLRGKGSDPPPGPIRDVMLETMKKRDVMEPSKVLASRDVAVVLLRAFIPPGAKKGDKVDVEVYLPSGDSTESLKGGQLFTADMTPNVEFKTKKGAALKSGDRMLTAEGPVLVTDNGPKDPASLKKGTVLNGGQVLSDRTFALILGKESSASLTEVRNRVNAIAHQINHRFGNGMENARDPIAKAKTDRRVDLRLPKSYRNDIERFLLVVRRIPLETSEVFVNRILADLEADLLDPATSLDASLRLEAIGKQAQPTLRKGLPNSSDAVRFCSAMSLAYMQDATGVSTLSRLAERSPEYRPYALGGLVASNHSVARMELVRLLNGTGAELRYGAFRALGAFDRTDSLVAGQPMPGEFVLHAMPSSAEPMVHLSSNFKQEIVVFNPDQQLVPPMSLQVGEWIMVTAGDGDPKAHLSSFRPEKTGVKDARVDSTLKVVDVVRHLAMMGANYTEICEFLKKAHQQGNLAGRLEINALPKPIPMTEIAELAKSRAPGGRVDAPTGQGLFSIEKREGRPVAANESETDSRERKQVETSQRKWPWNVFDRKAQ